MVFAVFPSEQSFPADAGDGASSLAEIAFNALRDAIVEGRLPPGKAIRQEPIAARLGVSKIPLREALTRLEQEGLVRSHRNRGFTVAPLSLVEAFEVLRLRQRIEPVLMGEACERATPEERAQALAAFEALRRAGHAPGVDRLAQAFQRLLYAPGGGALVIGVADRLVRLSDRYRIAYGLSRADPVAPDEEPLLTAWILRRRIVVEQGCEARIAKLIDDLSSRAQG